MNKIISFLMVGLFFALFNVATVAADVPAPTGDDTHNTTGEDCANLKNEDGSAADPDAVAACHQRKSSHADGNHGGMAEGTDAMCGGVPCTTAGDGGVALTIDDPRCAVGLAPGTRAKECPNYRP
jgi:hypothetical protein